MALLVMTCPHCAADKMTFHVGSVLPHQGRITRNLAATGICQSCYQPVIVDFRNPTGMSVDRLDQYPGDLRKLDDLAVENIWPKALPIDVPLAVPDRIARAYTEAATARRVQLWNSACGAYRRCLELSLKEFAPEVAAPTLVKRIDKLAAEHRITPAIQAWAHDLRLDGNEAVHGDEEATPEIADQMHNLTYFVLTYLYTLPKQVEQARERRAGGEVA